MPREILVDWVTPAGSGFRSVFHFVAADPVATQRADLATMLGTIDNLLDSNTLWTIETTGRELDDNTGTLTAVWTEATAKTGAGAVAGQCVPDAAQILLRWNSGSIVNGRFVKGRNYIPGLSTASVTDGNIAAAALTSFNAAVATFQAALNGFGIWHRPVAGAGGLMVGCQSASVWSEFAVLRHRRG